jgi:DNA-directed RNA polymerase specialized sigma24 family protein
VIALRAFEGLSNSEAAEELDEKPNTVAQRYKRALSKLRELLPDSIFEDLPDDD